MEKKSIYLLLFQFSCTLSIFGTCAIFYEIRRGRNHGERSSGVLQKVHAIESLDLKTSPHRRDYKTKININPVVIFNVQPKSGSRTLNSLVGKLNKSIVMLNTMNGINETQEEKAKIIWRAIRSNETTFLYSHRRYEWMGPYGPAHGARRPIYVSIVRDPIERLASAFYFSRYGDNVPDKTAASYQFRELMKSRNLSNETFDQCILRGSRSCRNPGALVRHFSGYHRFSMNRSLGNVERKYHVVGIMEDYTAFLKVLEKLIPGVFEGIVALYEEEKRDLIRTMKTRGKTKVSPKVRAILLKEMEEDYALYYKIKSRFEKLKLDLHIAEHGEVPTS